MRQLCYFLLMVSTSVAAQTKAVDVDAVRQCILNIEQQNECEHWVAVQDVRKKDRRVSDGTATVITEIDLKVLKSFYVGSPVANSCTGKGWSPGGIIRTNDTMMGSYFLVGQELMVTKDFEFQKFESGWRCVTTTLSPVSVGNYLNNVLR